MDNVTVATSTEPADDLLASWLVDRGFSVYRGELHNVAARMVAAADLLGTAVIVRVSGDSPLLDHRLVDLAVERYLGTEVDLVTNVFPRTFPVGQSVEVFRSSLLEHVLARLNPAQAEHVTSYFYEHEKEYTIVNIRSNTLAAELRLAVDTSHDYERLKAFFESAAYHPEVDYLSVTKWFEDSQGGITFHGD